MKSALPARSGWRSRGSDPAVHVQVLAALHHGVQVEPVEQVVGVGRAGAVARRGRIGGREGDHVVHRAHTRAAVEGVDRVIGGRVGPHQVRDHPDRPAERERARREVAGERSGHVHVAVGGHDHRLVGGGPVGHPGAELPGQVGGVLAELAHGRPVEPAAARDPRERGVGPAAGKRVAHRDRVVDPGGQREVADRDERLEPAPVAHAQLGGVVAQRRRGRRACRAGAGRRGRSACPPAPRRSSGGTRGSTRSRTGTRSSAGAPRPGRCPCGTAASGRVRARSGRR